MVVVILAIIISISLSFLKKKFDIPRWGFNEKSFFLKSWVRYATYVVTFLLVISMPSVMIREEENSSLIWAFIGSVVVGVIIGYCLTSEHLKHTEFFEWDIRERKSKQDYTLALFLVSAILSVLLVLSVALFGLGVHRDMFLFYIVEAPSLVAALRILTPLILLFNVMQFVHLYSPFWDGAITQKVIRKKPIDWE